MRKRTLFSTISLLVLISLLLGACVKDDAPGVTRVSPPQPVLDPIIYPFPAQTAGNVGIYFLQAGVCASDAEPAKLVYMGEFPADHSLITVHDSLDANQMYIYDGEKLVSVPRNMLFLYSTKPTNVGITRFTPDVLTTFDVSAALQDEDAVAQSVAAGRTMDVDGLVLYMVLGGQQCTSRSEG